MTLLLDQISSFPDVGRSLLLFNFDDLINIIFLNNFYTQSHKKYVWKSVKKSYVQYFEPIKLTRKEAKNDDYST